MPSPIPVPSLRELGVEAEIEHWDAGTVGSKNVDLIVTSEDFAERFADRDNVVYLKKNQIAQCRLYGSAQHKGKPPFLHNKTNQ